MLGLLMMSVPLGLAVGLSVVALIWPESDGSTSGVEENTRHDDSAIGVAAHLGREPG
jgi:hypothetical protein